MEFKFNVNEIFPQPIVEISNNLIPPGFTGDRRALWNAISKVTEVVNAMGEASAAAQGLSKPITTADRLRNSEHKLYFLIDQSANNGKGAVTGMLKTGKKGLYIFDRNGEHHQVSPPCVLDFYIHESRQRTGLGKQLFEHMLQKDTVEPIKMAIDRPSDKFLGFLKKHYCLNDPIRQMNNYVVFDGFFADSEKNGIVENNNSPIPVQTTKSANGLQNFSSPAAFGRYAAPRPPCSMGQIIHNQSSTVQKSQEPTGVQSVPLMNHQMYNQNQAQQYMNKPYYSETFIQQPNVNYSGYPHQYTYNNPFPPQVSYQMPANVNYGLQLPANPSQMYLPPQLLSNNAVQSVNNIPPSPYIYTNIPQQFHYNAPMQANFPLPLQISQSLPLNTVNNLNSYPVQASVPNIVQNPSSNSQQMLNANQNERTNINQTQSVVLNTEKETTGDLELKPSKVKNGLQQPESELDTIAPVVDTKNDLLNTVNSNNVQNVNKLPEINSNQAQNSTPNMQQSVSMQDNNNVPNEVKNDPPKEQVQQQTNETQQNSVVGNNQQSFTPFVQNLTPTQLPMQYNVNQIQQNTPNIIPNQMTPQNIGHQFVNNAPIEINTMAEGQQKNLLKDISKTKLCIINNNGDINNNNVSAGGDATNIEEKNMKFGYPPQYSADIQVVVEEKPNTSPKLERPRSLSIQQSDENNDDEINNVKCEEPEEDEIINIETNVEKINISTENDQPPPNDEPDKTTGKKTPSHLTEQGFFDLKFYHNKLW